MGKEYIEPMVVDRNGNIYISMREYEKDMKEIKEKILDYRKRLLSTRNTMKKFYKKNPNKEEHIKALGYIDAIDYLERQLLELIGEDNGRKVIKNN